MENHLEKSEAAARLEMLLLSEEKDSVLLGLELAQSQASLLAGVTPVAALSLFHRSVEVRDLAARTMSRLAGADLRSHIGLHWEPTHLKGRAEVFYKAVREIGRHPDIDERSLTKMAVRLSHKAPERAAQHFPLAFLEWARTHVFQGDSLHLDGYEFPFLPHSIGELPQLRYLSLKECGLRRLPPALARLKRLTRLDLSHNSLTELPDFLAELPELYDLRWRDNPIAQFPKILSKIDNLQKLDLDMRHVKDLRGLEDCKQVRWLNLKDAKLKTVPEQVLALKKLVSLEIAEAGLEELPREIGMLKELEELNLGANAIRNLPREVLGLRKLRSLALGKVREVGEIKSLSPLSGLWRLTMEPEFEEWPGEWCALPDLRELHLSEGKLKRLPSAFTQLGQVGHLDLSQNHFEHFPEVLTEMPELRELNFHSNRISILPPSIGRMTSLTVLDLSHNPLKTLPEEIFELRRLVRLDLHNCQLPKELQERLREELPRTKVRFS